MYIAIEMKKLLDEKVAVDAKVVESLPFKMFCRPEDSMCLADHVWLNGLKNMEYRDAMRSGNNMLDAGMAAGALLGESTDGIYVTSIENLLSSKSVTNGKVTVSFVGSLKEAVDLYCKKTEKTPAKRTRRVKEKAVEAAPSSVQECAIQVQKPVKQENEVAEPVTDFTDVPFAMPAPEDDAPVEAVTIPEADAPVAEIDTLAGEVPETVTPVEEEKLPEVESSTVEIEEDKAPKIERNPFATEEEDENPFANMPEPTVEPTVEAVEEPKFPLKDQSDRSKALVFDENGYPEGPEFDQFKKAAIGSGVSNANVPFALTALQISEGVDDLLHSLVVVFGNYRSEAYTTYDTVRNNFDKLKLYADQVVPFEIRVN